MPIMLAILAFVLTGAAIAGYIYLVAVHGPVILLAALAVCVAALIVLAPIAAALTVYGWVAEFRKDRR